MKVYSYKNGDVFFEKSSPSGMYIVRLRNKNGQLMDKVMCNDYRDALIYKRAFTRIAKHDSTKRS